MRKERNSLMSSSDGHSTTRGSKTQEEMMDSHLRRNDHKGKSETGRSMVEMLGVLAVIGVISIGGIVGYNLAMSKHRVNELLDGASKRAMAVSTQMMLKAPTNLDEFTEYNATSGGTFSGTVTELDNDQFAILVGDVSKETCIGLIKSIGDKTPLRDITTQADTATPLTAENCLDENNQLALIFNKDMKNKATTDNEQSGGGNADSSSSSGGEPKDPSCSAYPGTDPDNAGGVAGKADDGTTDCKCPENEEWNADDRECVDNRPLYVTIDESNTHVYFESHSPNCPDGYHWASLSEVKRDFNCVARGGGYECDSFDFVGWLKDCTNDGETVTACNSASLAFAAGFGYVDASGRVDDSYASDFAVCRRN